MHGGVPKERLNEENIEALEAELKNLEKHIETIQAFGVPYVVAGNRFITDSKRRSRSAMNWCTSKECSRCFNRNLGKKAEKAASCLLKNFAEVMNETESQFFSLYECQLQFQKK